MGTSWAVCIPVETVGMEVGAGVGEKGSGGGWGEEGCGGG